MTLITHPIITDPSICIVRSRQHQRPSPEFAALLLPVDPASFHEQHLQPRHPVELHYHNIDEYWWFTAGHPLVTLRTASGVTREFQLGPGDMVATARGVEHTLTAPDELVYFEFNSPLKACPHGGRHLHRTL